MVSYVNRTGVKVMITGNAGVNKQLTQRDSSDQTNSCHCTGRSSTNILKLHVGQVILQSTGHTYVVDAQKSAPVETHIEVVKVKVIA